MNQQRHRASRRKFLASIGATTAMLPFLRILPGYAAPTPPTNLILMFSANGRIRHLWGADDSTGSLVFRQNLAPLQPLAQHVVVTEGIRNYAAPIIGGTHEGGMMSLFTGAASGSQSGGPVGFPSLDTVFMANAAGTARKDSLYQQVVAVLNSAENAGPQNRCIFDASGVPRDPLRSGWEVMEQYMNGAVQSMTGPTAQELLKSRAQSARLEALNKQMSALMPRLCREDQYQLQGMQDALSKAGQTVDQVVCTLPTLPTKPTPMNFQPIWAPPSDTIDFSKSTHWYRERSRLAIDLLVAAIACGVTRSGVLQYDQAASVARAAGQALDHHNTSHQQPQLYDFVQRIPGTAPDYKETCLEHEADPLPAMRTSMANVWKELSVWEHYYAEEFAYLVSQLSSHGVLERTAVVWASEIDTGNGHSHYNMPFLVAAGPGVPIKRGKVVRFPVSYDRDNQMGCIPSTGVSPSHNDFMRTMLQALGVSVPSVGSVSAGTTQLNKGVLSELLA